MLFFYKIIWKIFFFGHSILTEGVFVTRLSRNAVINLAICVGYDRLLFFERYVFVIQILTPKLRLVYFPGCFQVFATYRKRSLSAGSSRARMKGRGSLSFQKTLFLLQ